MFTGIVRNIASLGSATNFEKSRLQATYNGDTEAPNEYDLQVILLNLSGKNPDTRPQIAFTTILQKLESSKSKFKWNYLVKNLIILDRCVDERYFVQDISNLKINHVETYNETDSLYQSIQVDQFIRLYFRYIKFKAFIYCKKTTSFNMSREEIKPYFVSQQPAQIFDEFGMTQRLQEIIMEVGNTDKKGHLKFKVNQYVYLLLLFTLTNLFSTQYLATLTLVEKLVTMTQDEAQQFKTLYNRYLKQNEELVCFINSHKYIKCYADINIDDFSKCDNRIIAAIDDYLQFHLNKDSVVDLPEEIIFEDDQELIFEKTDKLIRKSMSNFLGIEEGRSFRSKVRKFDLKVEQSNNVRYHEAEFKTFDDHLWCSFQDNYCSDYKMIDKSFFRQRESMLKEGLRYHLGQEEDDLDPIRQTNNDSQNLWGYQFPKQDKFMSSPDTLEPTELN